MALKKIKILLTVFGPGIIVMLADTDAGSLITAAQTGAVWGYRMILLQALLIPILYITQELTVRLGVVTRVGHGQLIQRTFGTAWAWLSVATLVVTCVGAILTQFAGISGVGALFGIPCWLSLSLSIFFLLAIVMSGTYRSVERCAIALGLFELVFIAVAWMAHPLFHDVRTQFFNIPLNDPHYFYLAAANIGAVIMPWMIFYQQSAIVDKHMSCQEHGLHGDACCVSHRNCQNTYMRFSRIDTAIGAVVTQLIMMAVMITTASTIGKINPGCSLNNVHQFSDALIPFLGMTAGKLLFAAGMLGASLVAAIVVSLTAAWGLGEITGYRHSLEHKPSEAPWFYLAYAVVLLLGGVLVASHVNLVRLSVAIEVMNALLLPIVLGFLYVLAIKVLPGKYRLKGIYAWVVGIFLGATVLLGVGGGIVGLFA
ncbi:MAG: divalent metal cation transporter [Gammaproteobacteria bacterium]|nr:divalent metal cation transporter [Gammaproteobacteria bacterium]